LKTFFKKTPFTNYVEFYNYKKLSELLPMNLFKNYFYKIYDIQEVNGEELLLGELILNDDKTISKSILEFGKISDENFWKILDEIIEVMIKNKIYFYDINSKNILVKKIDNKLIPMFIDYKRFWRKFNFQLDLIFESRKISKMIRNYTRLKEEFKN